MVVMFLDPLIQHSVKCTKRLLYGDKVESTKGPLFKYEMGERWIWEMFKTDRAEV